MQPGLGLGLGWLVSHQKKKITHRYLVRSPPEVDEMTKGAISHPLFTLQVHADGRTYAPTALHPLYSFPFHSTSLHLADLGEVGSANFHSASLAFRAL